MWGQGQHLPHGDAQLHRGRANNYAKNGLQKQPFRMEMQLRMGYATAWGQGQHLPHGGANLHQGGASKYARNGILETIVLGMQSQLRMGCATRWRQSAWDAQRHYMGQGKKYASSRC